MDVKLFGIVPFKQVDVHVVEGQRLIPAGVPVGIYIKTEGIFSDRKRFLKDWIKQKGTGKIPVEGGRLHLKVDGVELEGESSSLGKCAASEGKKELCPPRLWGRTGLMG